MQWDGEALALDATDLTRFVACRRLTRLDRERALGAPPRDRAAGTDPAGREPRRPGDHGADRRALDRLRARGLVVREIPDLRTPSGGRDWAQVEPRTVEAMAAGVGVVHGGGFVDGPWRLGVELLLRRDDRSGRWPWSYDLARSQTSPRVRTDALLELAVAGERLAAVQGIAPDRLVVITGDGTEHVVPYADCAAHVRVAKAALRTFLRDLPPTTPDPVPHCGRCAWATRCRQDRAAADDLSQVAGLRSWHAAVLRASGIESVRALADAPPSRLMSSAPRDLPPSVAVRLQEQARLQVRARAEGGLPHRALGPEPDRGLALLPAPSHGDLFFDIEGDPHVGGHGLEYLFGLVDTEDRYTAYWAVEPEREQAAFEALVDHLIEAWRRDPGMHVYHYAAYEPLRLQSLSMRYGTRAAEVDRLLRGGRLVDLYAVVKQGVQIGTPSYSLKKLEPLYWRHARDGEAVSDALGSVAAFETWRAERDDRLLEAIRSYNQQDCRSTRALRDWAEAVRAAAGGDSVFGRPASVGGPVDGPVDGPVEPGLAAVIAREEDLRRQLLATLPPAVRPEDAVRTHEQQIVWLLAMLLGGHRRQGWSRWSTWWRHRAMTTDELIADHTALGGLADPEPVAAGEAAALWRLRFPAQESTVGADDATWEDPRRGRPVEVVEVDLDDGWLTVRQGAALGPPTIGGLIPARPEVVPPLASRLVELAETVLREGISSPGPAWRAARQLLERRTVPVPDRPPGSAPIDAVVAVVAEVTNPPEATNPPEVTDDGVGTVMAIQAATGPAGDAAVADLVLGLVSAGRRVGLCARSSRRIAQLLHRLRAAGRPVDRASDPAAQVVAGTPELFGADPGSPPLDVLIVADAGRLWLGDVLAASSSARALVLCGDRSGPARTLRGQHPRGVDVSALGHLSGPDGALAPERGIVLDTLAGPTELCRLLGRLTGADRLTAEPGRAQVRLGAGGLRGAGLRWVPVTGADRPSGASPDVEADLEADLEAVVRLVRDALADGWWTDHTGQHRRLRPDDVLVLAATHRQAQRIRRALHDHGLDVRARAVGRSSDDGPGQEAVLVVQVLTAAGPAETPRGPEDLLDPLRFVEAVSLAQAMVAVVGSPELLTAPVSTPAQLRLVNLLCEAAERAQAEGAAAPSEESVQVTVRP